MWFDEISCLCGEVHLNCHDDDAWDNIMCARDRVFGTPIGMSASVERKSRDERFGWLGESAHSSQRSKIPSFEAVSAFWPHMLCLSLSFLFNPFQWVSPTIRACLGRNLRHAEMSQAIPALNRHANAKGEEHCRNMEKKSKQTRQ